MIKKEYGHIDFSRGKDAVHNLVRGNESVALRICNA